MKYKTKIKYTTRYVLCDTRSQGFVILFAVVVSSIILAVTLAVANVSLKEIKFSTSAKDTNDAFFAADAGAECALFNDKSTQNKFSIGGPAQTITCASVSILPTFSSGFYKFTIPNLGSTGQGCAVVTVDKSISPTIIISKGYNIGDVSCNFSSANRVERQIELTY
jgi:Tfp pilus assembly protein PilX